MPPKTRSDFEREAELITEIPKLYAVMLHNDDYTPQDFVVFLLVNIFHKDELTAETLMLEVHKNGIGTAGVYPFDIAATKKLQAEKLSSEKGHPLMITLSEEVR